MTIGLAALVVIIPSAKSQEAPAVLLVLDASGSMNSIDDSGRSLLEGAQDSLVALVEALPEGGIDVGLRVYGHRTSNDDPVRGCQDSELVVPVGPLDRSAMIGAIRGVRASGYTPIGLSLEQAAEDLAGRDAATVILVSDGEDTCAPPDPCDVAAGLAEAGVTVNTVGFYLDAGSLARGQLQCIADATGGTYRDVEEAGDLAGVVGVFMQAVPGMGNLHLPLNGATTRALAPVLPLVSVGGPHQPGLQAAHTTAIAAGETRWFTVEVDDSAVISINTDTTPFIEAAIPDPGDEVFLSIVDAGGESVLGVETFALGRMDLGMALAIDLPFFSGLGATTSEGVSPWHELEQSAQEGWEVLGFDADTWNLSMRDRLRYHRPELLSAGTYYIGITWESDLDAETAIDFLVGVGTETLENRSEPIQLDGSTDPEEATLIEQEFPGYDPWPLPLVEADPSAELVVEGHIATGETRWYAMDVEWDETLWVEALLDVADDAPLADGDRLSIEIHDPTGVDVTLAHPYVEPVSGTVSELPAFERSGYHPRPRVAASAREEGPDSSAPGIYLVGVTWEGEGSEGTLELRLGGGGLDGMVEMPRLTASSTTMPGASSEEAANEGDEVREAIDLGVVVAIGIAVLGVLGIGLVLWRRTKRTRHLEDEVRARTADLDVARAAARAAREALR